MSNTEYKILLIEDDKLDQTAFMRMVKEKELPYDCTVAASVSEALSILAEKQFDIIIADYMLGDGTAFDILNSVKNIPVVIVTGAGDEEVAVRVWKAGCNDYLSKPVLYSKLIEILGKYLKKENSALVDEPDNGKGSENHLSRTDSDNEKIIDWAQITANGLDEQLMKEIVPTYIKDNKEHLRELITAVKKGKAKDVKSHAHAIKGAGRNMGAAKLSELARQLEAMELEGALSKAQTLLNDIISEFHKLEEFVSKPDWIEIAKREKVVTDEKLNANATC